MGNLHISLIQTDLFWEDKFRNLEMLEKKIASVEAATQIVVLPEMFTTVLACNQNFLPKPWKALR